MNKQTSTNAPPAFILNAEPNAVYNSLIPAGNSGGPPLDINDFSIWQDLYGLASFSSNITDILSTEEGKQKWTVLVPSDGAFTALGPTVLAYLKEPKNESDLQTLLQFHLVESDTTTLAQNFVPNELAVLPELLPISTVLIPPSLKTKLNAVYTSGLNATSTASKLNKGFSRKKKILFKK